MKIKVYTDPTYPLAHELGHTTGTLDDGGSAWNDFWSSSRMATFEMNNVNKWENPIMSKLEGITRRSYNTNASPSYGKTFFPRSPH